MNVVTTQTRDPATINREIADLAHQYFTGRNWVKALALYQVLGKTNQHALIDHAQALCLVGMGKFTDAVNLLDQALLKDSGHWASSLMKARLLTHLGQPALAEQILIGLSAHPDAGSEAQLDLALLELSDFGNPNGARQKLEPLLKIPSLAEKANAAWIVTNFYDRDCTALQLTQHLSRFASTHLKPKDSEAEAYQKFCQGLKKRPLSTRKKIGFLSPLFTASPVYFLTISTLRALRLEADLVFYDRNERKADWATEQFKQLATQWHSVHQHNSLQLAQLMASDQLDAIIDMGGWMDWAGLKALSFKPAPRQLKWVGGQSTSTGMHCFDGFVCDEWHIPPELSYLYSEPLIRVPGGYADYTPPVYLPRVVASSKRTGGLGVIANPNKLSRAFFEYLALEVLPEVLHRKMPLLFIERRFNRPALQEYVVNMLKKYGCTNADVLHKAGYIRFSAPRTHPEFLAQLSNLAELLDTFPYSSGLTAAEADILQINIRLRTGELFCERHSHALAQKKQFFKNQHTTRGPDIAQFLLDYL